MSPAPTTSCARSRKSSPRLYNDRAIAYRVHHGFKHEDVFLSAGVQLMVRSDVGASGVLFTLDTESGFRDVVFITVELWPRRERSCRARSIPTSSTSTSRRCAQGKPAILRRSLGAKQMRMVYSDQPGERVRNEETPAAICATASRISDADVHELAKQALVIEQHYGRPMDIEWAKDGVSGKLYIVQARPETVKSRGHATQIERYALQQARRRHRRRPRDRPEDRQRHRARRALARRHEPRAARRRAGRRHDRSRLGTGHEARVGDRHQSRRPHLPRGDHRARARRAGRGRHRQRARPHRGRQAKSPSAAPKATPVSSTPAPCPSSAPRPTSATCRRRR